MIANPAPETELNEISQMSFTGRFVPESFVGFARHRAERLDLDMRLISSDALRVDIEIAGQPDLVDAFEMALVLGPLDCVVMDCRRFDTFSTK